MKKYVIFSLVILLFSQKSFARHNNNTSWIEETLNNITNGGISNSENSSIITSIISLLPIPAIRIENQRPPKTVEPFIDPNVTVNQNAPSSNSLSLPIGHK